MAWPPPGFTPYGSGYRVTLGDFRGLVSYAPYQEATAQLLRRWFGYRIEGTGDTALILTADGHPVDTEDLHRRIQENPQQQFDLYQTAMSLWR